MARITVEDCIDKIPSRFELVLLASQRARKLHTGDQPTVEKENDKNTVIALREIEEKTMSLEILKENLINDYQTVSKIDNLNENYEIINLFFKGGPVMFILLSLSILSLTIILFIFEFLLPI